MSEFNQDYLFGMDYLSYMWNSQGVPFEKGFELLHNLGVRSIRHWMHFDIYMSDYHTIDPQGAEFMHTLLAEAAKYRLQVIGMSHVNWSLDKQTFCIGKPARSNPSYRRWLACYEETWYQAGKEFPEVSLWEIDNEINNKDFMYIEGKFGEKLPTEELAAMAADLLFFASRGIHRANPDAMTIMGGIVDPIGLGIPETGTGTTMRNFLEALYDAIESGSHGSTEPDDFFQKAAWHPYYYKCEPDDYFIEQNNKIYEIIRRREGKEKGVFLTELGWDEKLMEPDKIPSAIEKLFQILREEMPYVHGVQYYRFFDNVSEGNCLAGLFCDPNPERVDCLPGSKTRRAPGSPKPGAYAFQKAAGGNGSLRLVEKTGQAE